MLTRLKQKCSCHESAMCVMVVSCCIGCKSQEENRKLKAMVQEKLSDNYEVREVTGVYPRIKLVGMNCKYSEETLKNLIRVIRPYFLIVEILKLSNIFQLKRMTKFSRL
nr:unnamed protein product [Callosobruchus analis]